jgi:oligosaccharide amylase
MLVGLDGRGQVRDFYYPFVGESNHVSGASGGFVHRVGVFVDGVMRWFDDPAWQFDFSNQSDYMTGFFTAYHSSIGLRIKVSDAVHNEKNVFLRSFVVCNETDQDRTVQLIFSQQFRIGESRRGDTAFYDPRVKAIIHYKGHTTFLVNAFSGDVQFRDFNIGLFGIEGKEGTYMDANDGVLERNPIEHGSVDSVIGVTLNIPARGESAANYWVVAGPSVTAVHELDEYVIGETPERLVRSTEAYWQAWIEKDERSLEPLAPATQTLYRRSLMTMRVHADNHGGIIASSDTDMLHHGRDTYAYVWPRDAALIAYAFDKTGYPDVAKRFFEFTARVREPAGYLMHKYRSDGVLGSSWHPWLRNGRPCLPIQEDETATTIVALWHHYERVRDVEFIESLYNSFIEPAAVFMCEYIEPRTGLPQPSYDLWEEKYGSSTYTASAVYGALMASARFATILGKDHDARTYQAVAQRMQQAIVRELYDEKIGMFVKHLVVDDDGHYHYDRTLDMSSFYGPLFFGVVEDDDPRLTRAAQTVMERLQVTEDSRGYVRYEGDGYYRMHDASSPNPWVVTTMWMAQYLIRRARTLDDLKIPRELLDWTVSHAAGSGMLAEQMHPRTRAHLSTAPLIWSHAEFVLAVNAYLERLSSLSTRDL